MADGEVRGGFSLDARAALDTLGAIRDKGAEADTSLANLGRTMDGVGSTQANTRLGAYKRKLTEVATAAEKTSTKVATSWDAQQKAIDKSATAIESRIDRLQVRLDRYGESRSSAEISLSGFDEVNAQLAEIQARLNNIGRRRTTANVNVRESASGGGGAAASSAASSAGGFSMPGGFLGKLAIGGLALSPGLVGLAGGATALAGSATSAALGAGSIGLGAYGTLGAGAALSAGAIIPAVKNLAALTTAQQKYTQAVQAFGRASSQAAAAKRTYDAALAGGTPAEVSAATQLGLLRSGFRSGTAPGRASVYRSASSVLYDARGALPSVTGSVNRAAGATAGAAASLGGFLTDPQSLRTLQALTGSFVTNLPVMEHSLQNVAAILEHLSVDALPFFHEAVVWVDHWTAGMAKSSGDTAKVSHDMQRMVVSLKDWGRLTGSVVDTVRDIFEAGTPAGNSMVVQLTDTFQKWDRWIQDNPGKVSSWFTQAATTTDHIARTATAIVGDVSKIANELTPTFDRAMDILGALAKVGGGGIGGLATVAAGYGLARRGIRSATGRTPPSAFRVARTAVTGSPYGLAGGRSGTSTLDLHSWIVGSRGPTLAGSFDNPFAVVVVDPSGSPVGRSGRSVGAGAAGAGETAARDTEAAAGATAGGGRVASILARARGGATRLADGAARGGTIAIGGYLASQIAKPLLTPLIGAHAAGKVSSIGGDAAIGAGIGSAIEPGGGTLIGGAAGTLYGLLAHLGSVSPASMTAGGLAGVGSTVSQAASPSSAAAARSFAQITTSAQHLTGGLNALPVSQLKLLQRDAQDLAKDPSLAKYSRQIQGAASAVENALVGKAAPAFKTMQQQAGKSLADIEQTTTSTTNTIKTTLGRGTLAAQQAVSANYQQAAKDIATSMQDGVVSTAAGTQAIFTDLSKALQALGLHVGPKLVSQIGAAGAESLIKSATATRDPSNASTGGTNATGGRIPGRARGDHTPILGHGGGLLGMADGGELIVNQHTERDVNRDLAAAGRPMLGTRVANETRKHYATGGRISAPTDTAPGEIGVIGQDVLNQITTAANRYLTNHTPHTAASGGAGPNFPVHGGPVPAKVQRAKEAAIAIAHMNLPYGHEGAGWGLGAYDCSSFESTVFDSAGITGWGPGVYWTAAGPINDHTLPGPGKWITVGTKGTTGNDAHTMFEIDGMYFESSHTGLGPHIDSGWSEPFDQYRHPAGFARGGRMGDQREGHPGHQPTQAQAMEMQRRRRAHQRVDWGGWNRRGGSFLTNGATLFGAGENGHERVSITPLHEKGPGGGVTVNMAGARFYGVSSATAGDLAEQVAEKLLEALNRVGQGASDAQLMGADA